MAQPDNFGIEWPLRPDGTEVPVHRRSRWAYEQGYPVFCASDWRRNGNLGEWRCGYCEKWSTDPLSPSQGQTLADCTQCGKSNRINLD